MEFLQDTLLYVQKVIGNDSLPVATTYFEILGGVASSYALPLLVNASVW